MSLASFTAPVDQDLCLRSGNSFGPFTFTLRDGDGGAIALTGYSAAAEVRKCPGGDLLGAFTAAVTDAAGGVVTLTMDVPTVDAVVAAGGGVYDLLLYLDDDNSSTIAEGRVQVDVGVTENPLP